MRELSWPSVCIAFLFAATAHANEGYLRYPDIHGDRVVFTAEADLWIAPAGGGTATRLTTHVGGEGYPRFSPDGRRIAFTGQYDGNADLFVVPASGGEPRRLTWHPGADVVVGWTPDGETILFLSSREHPHGSPEIFAVPAGGGDATKLPVGWVTHLAVEPDGERWAFTRTGGGGTWKRYRGGTARSIWVGEPQREDFREVTSFDGMNAFPMWHGERIYYLSDAGGTANLWSMNPDGSDSVRHTRFDEWDARYPAMGPDGRIVFMLAGNIHLFDPASGEERRIDIELPSDRVLTRTRYPNAAGAANWFELSPDGERLVVTARGEIFSVPVEDGVTLPVTRGSGARESWGSFDSEGKRLVFVTDESREEEIRVVDAWGRGEPEGLGRAGRGGWHYPPVFSPDDAWIAYADQTQALWIVAAKGGKPKQVDRAEQLAITDYAWSPDSRWLAYTKMARTDYRSVYVYDTREDEVHRVTTDDTDDHSPAWDPEGRYLYFLSDRHTNPLLGARDMQNINIKPTRPYLALLRADVDHPFADRAGRPPREDEPTEDDASEADGAKTENADSGQPEEDGKEGKEKDEKKDAAKPVEIEFDGLAGRVVEFPVAPDQCFALEATATHVFWVTLPLVGMAEWGALFGPTPPRATLMQFDLKTEKATPFMTGISGYDLAAKAGKLAIVKQPGEVYVVGAAAPPGPDLSESRIDLGGVVVELDPLEEWAQIYHEAWRHMRDFYWDPGLGSVDWEAVRDRYATLLPRLATRSDLGDLVAEMIGELSTSHTYVWGGDPGVAVPGRRTGLLGADLVREGDAFRIERIYRGAPADNERSPLLEPGAGVKEGEYLVAVNNLPFEKDRPIHAHLDGYAGKPVLLGVNDEPTTDGARDVVVTPLDAEGGARYADWVRRNREYVAAKTDGRIGYVHVPDMMQAGMIEFNTWFYPQLDREGMVVDMRWNGGGFVSQMIVERFRRHVLSFNRARGGRLSTYPYRTLNGPFVVLTNQFAGSDGDIFPAAVQLEGLAPVIGKRSWGGVVGINSLRPMVDGGVVTQPASAWWDPSRGWELENRGVEPDVEVENLPQELGRGVDAQLDRGIEEVLKLHAENPPLEPEFGPVRPRDRDAYRHELSERSASR